MYTEIHIVYNAYIIYVYGVILYKHKVPKSCKQLSSWKLLILFNSLSSIIGHLWEQIWVNICIPAVFVHTEEVKYFFQVIAFKIQIMYHRNLHLKPIWLHEPMSPPTTCKKKKSPSQVPQVVKA